MTMLRVINKHSAAIDDIAPKAEGVMADTAPVRAMVAAGMLEVVGEAPGAIESGPVSGGSSDPSGSAEMREMTARFDRAYAAQGEHLDRARAQLAQVQADRDDLAARLEASEAARAALETAHAASLAASSAASAAAEKSKADKAKDKG